MTGQLLTSLSIEDVNGVDIPLILDPVRRVMKATGLIGVSAREVLVQRAGRNGSINLTRYRDAGQIVIEGALTGGTTDDTWFQYDQVAGALSDSIADDRLLKWTAGTSRALQQAVRLVSIEPPLEVGADIIRYQVTLRAADPNVYSQELKKTSATPLGSGAGGGLQFPITFPFQFAQPVNTIAAFNNEGTVSTPPILDLQGGLTDPVIRLSSDIALVFSGTIADSDVLTIDVAKRTVMLNGTENRRYMLVTSKSIWFELPRGSGELTLEASVYSAGANLAVSWRDARS